MYVCMYVCIIIIIDWFSDVDECVDHNGGCQHKCVNTHGGFYCECPKGQRLHADGRTCIRKLSSSSLNAQLFFLFLYIYFFIPSGTESVFLFLVTVNEHVQCRLVAPSVRCPQMV